jgi:putative endonuclease
MGTFSLSSPIGTLGERIGCQYLQQKGYRILERNYCNAHGRRLGEIDIVAEKEKKLIFVEVKTRIDPGTSLPEENVTREKLRKLERVAVHYLREKHSENRPYAFDVLAITYDKKTKTAHVRHLESVFL